MMKQTAGIDSQPFRTLFILSVLQIRMRNVLAMTQALSLFHQTNHFIQKMFVPVEVYEYQQSRYLSKLMLNQLIPIDWTYRLRIYFVI